MRSHSHPFRRPVSSAVVVGCLEQPSEPLAVLGLDPRTAHLLSTAGGRVSDDVLAHLAHLCDRDGVRQIIVAHHPDCRWAPPSSPRVLPGDPAPSHDRLRHDVARILDHPLIPAEVLVSGLWLEGSGINDFEVVAREIPVPTRGDRRSLAA